MQDDTVKAIADRILRERLAPFGYERVAVRSGYDQDDEPALFIDAILGENAPQLPSEIMVDAHYALSRELLTGGEERFPYLYAHYPFGDFPEDVPIDLRGRA